ncbi:MAG: cation diffusion facilitator family transporter [Bauldia litoralis]
MPEAHHTTATTRGDAGRLMTLATYASTTVAVILIVAKLFAWWMTDSVAVLSTLIDSMLDAAASVLTLLAVHHAIQPADREHRFGHGKAEALAGLGQAAFVAGSGCLLMFEAVKRLIQPVPMQKEWVGVIVMVLAMVLTLALVAFQNYVVRKTQSVAITADSLHYKGDLLINGSVLAGLGIHYFWGVRYLDPLLAVGVVAYLLWNAWKIAMDALDMLMDRELPDEDRAAIKEIVTRHKDVRSFHDLRSRRSGTDMFIQLHLELDPDMPLVRAHEIADDVEIEILKAFPNAEVIIHQDPEGIEEDHPAVAGR